MHQSNERRRAANTIFNSLVEELVRQGDECRDQYREISQQLNGVVSTQTGFAENIKARQGSIGEVKEMVTPLVKSDAVQDKAIRDLEADTKNLYEMIGEDRKEFRAPSDAAPSTKRTGLFDFLNGPNGKYVFIVLGLFVFGIFGWQINDLGNLFP